MIKMYYGDGLAAYEQEGVENYDWNTTLGRKGSELLKNLKEGKKDTPGTEIELQCDYEGGYDLHLTNKGKETIQKFFDEYIFNLLPKDIRDLYVFKNPNLKIEIGHRMFGLMEIDLSLSWKDEKGWERYEICTICHEVIVK